MDNFDWKAFKKGLIKVNCRTEKDAIEFLNECHKHGADKWCSGTSVKDLTHFDCYKKNTVYAYSDDFQMEYSSTRSEINKGNDIKIIVWDGEMTKMNTNSIQEKIKRLEEKMKNNIEEINSLKEELSKRSQWLRCDIGETYYYMNGLEEVDYYEENKDNIDNGLFENANYFRTKEKVEEIAFKQILFRKLQRFADEKNEEKIDWKNSSQEKYIIVYDYIDKEFYVTSMYISRSLGQIYFDSKEAAEEAIKTFRDDLEIYFNI